MPIRMNEGATAGTSPLVERGPADSVEPAGAPPYTDSFPPTVWDVSAVSLSPEELRAGEERYRAVRMPAAASALAALVEARPDAVAFIGTAVADRPVVDRDDGRQTTFDVAETLRGASLPTRLVLTRFQTLGVHQCERQPAIVLTKRYLIVLEGGIGDDASSGELLSTWPPAPRLMVETVSGHFEAPGWITTSVGVDPILTRDRSGISGKAAR